MKIALITPAGVRSRSGNRHTATRWAAMLRSLGHRVRISTRWDSRAADAMIALHARRSAQSIAAFRERAAGRGMAVVLTGTDLYKDLPAPSEDVGRSLDLADRIVVLQEDAPHLLESRWRRKSEVIFQSARPLARRRTRVRRLGHPAEVTL